MIDSGRVEGIIAAMATTSDGWRLSCELDNIRDDGKVAAAFNVGYGDSLYILAIGGYGNDGESDLIRGALYIPGGHPLSGSIFIRTPMGVRVEGAMHWGFSDSDPQPLIKGGKRSPDRPEVSVSSNPVIIPRELADWVMGGLDLPGVALPPAECKPVKTSIASNADYWNVRIPGELCDQWRDLGIQLLDGGVLEEIGLSEHSWVVSRVLNERWDADLIKRKTGLKLSSVDGCYRGLLYAKLRGKLGWVGIKVLEHIEGYCDNANLCGATVSQIRYATITSMDRSRYPACEVAEGAAGYRALCNIATDWEHWQYFQWCSDEQAVLHAIHLNFSPTDIVEWDDVAME